VNHNAVIVNDRRVNIPSFEVQPGDVVQIREKSRGQERISVSLGITERIGFAPWVDVDVANYRGIYKNRPEREELPDDIDETLVIGYYSK